MPRNNRNNKNNGFRSLDMTISPRFWPGLPEQVSLDDTSSLFAAVKSTKGKPSRLAFIWGAKQMKSRWCGDECLTTWTKDLDFSPAYDFFFERFGLDFGSCQAGCACLLSRRPATFNEKSILFSSSAMDFGISLVFWGTIWVFQHFPTNLGSKP